MKEHEMTRSQLPARSWIRHSRRHADRTHQINVKLSGDADKLLRDIATRENLRLYEAIEKALAFYDHHRTP